MKDKNFIITDENAEEYIKKIGTFIKEQVTSAHMNGVVLGMSGGIDCSVVARLCQVADVNIKLLCMPNGTDMEKSKSMSDAMELINSFNFDFEIIDISKAATAIAEPLDDLSDISKINILPRIRMTTLYAVAQSSGRLVIGTGNLAERLLGYFTKWGDGACDLNPLAMLTKTEVRTLARHLCIPECIIKKPPSAGLFEGQTDENELGFSYQQIDAYILHGSSGDNAVDAKINRRITTSAHKLKEIAVFK